MILNAIDVLCKERNCLNIFVLLFSLSLSSIPIAQENVSKESCSLLSTAVVTLHCFASENRRIFFSLTLYALLESSFWFDTINLEWSIVYAEA